MGEGDREAERERYRNRERERERKIKSKKIFDIPKCAECDLIYLKDLNPNLTMGLKLIS